MIIVIPLEKFITFTGVSGSGKSSLVFEVINKYIEEGKALCDKIEGLENINNVIKIDQKQIGRLSRSNIATYSEVYTMIRELYVNLELAKNKKLKVSDFSFNVKGGRCENCQGIGAISLDMQFLEPIEVECPVCKGSRFKKKILEVEYKEKILVIY